MAKDPREYGYEGDMVISQLKSIMANAEKLMSMLKPETDLPEWVQLKITLAQDYVLTARDYMESEMKESVDDKFASTSYSTTRGKIVKTKSGSFIATNKSGSTKSFDDMNAAKKHADSGVDDSGVDEACWSGYVARGMKNKGGRMVPNCVPAEAVTTEKPPFEGPYKKVDKKKPVTRSHLKSLTKAARDTISKSANKKSK